MKMFSKVVAFIMLGCGVFHMTLSPFKEEGERGLWLCIGTLFVYSACVDLLKKERD